MPQGIEDLARFLTGTWRLRRSIVSGGVEVGRFTGTGTFAAATEADADADAVDVLRYLERGTLHLDGGQVEARRELRYRVAGTRAEVTFEDGRPFHDLDLHRGVDEAEHPCGPDRYLGRFEVVDDDTWHHAWRVTGPRKDHLIRTVLEREGEQRVPR